MSQSGQTPNQNRVTDLQVTGHLMTLDQGLFCVFHAPSQQPPGANGLPGVRLSLPPVPNDAVTIVTFDETGWLGGADSAALIRVTRGPAQVMVTIYQENGSLHAAPRLQVVRLSDAGVSQQAAAPQSTPAVAAAPVAARAATPAPAQAAPAAAAAQPAEISAHIQRRGDVGTRIGEWMGFPGSRTWIEGFGIAPDTLIGPEDIEYQAVLGKGWLSPWAEGGQYCGSRGMALPILGLRVRLKGDAAKKYVLELEATFTDGTETGVLGDDDTAESESLAPLEAFRLTILPRTAKASGRRKAAKVEEEAEDLDLALLEAAADLEALEELEELEEIEEEVIEKPARGRRRAPAAKAAPKATRSAKKAPAASPAALSRELPVMKKTTRAPQKTPRLASKTGRPATRKNGRR